MGLSSHWIMFKNNILDHDWVMWPQGQQCLFHLAADTSCRAKCWRSRSVARTLCGCVLSRAQELCEVVLYGVPVPGRICFGFNRWHAQNAEICITQSADPKIVKDTRENNSFCLVWIEEPSFVMGYVERASNIILNGIRLDRIGMIWQPEVVISISNVMCLTRIGGFSAKADVATATKTIRKFRRQEVYSSTADVGKDLELSIWASVTSPVREGDSIHICNEFCFTQ